MAWTFDKNIVYIIARTTRAFKSIVGKAHEAGYINFTFFISSFIICYANMIRIATSASYLKKRKKHVLKPDLRIRVGEVTLETP